MSSHSNKVSPDSDDAPAQPTCVEMPPEIRDKLLDPAIWQESLETYALTTHLAVALTDAAGRLIGECINPQPTWSLLHAGTPEAYDRCPFSLAPLKPCTCVDDALANGGPVMVRGRAGLVHFAVPLVLGGHQLGALVAGQVFDQYPEQLPLDQEARKFDLSQQKVWQAARLEHPVKRATLKIYGDLLSTLGNTFLQKRYHTIIEANRLSEMTRLRDLAVEEAAERKRAEEALLKSEEKYRTLFNSIDEGFCIIEKVKAGAGEPLDFRYVEANAAFAVQSGVSGVVGKTIRQAFPGEPEEWFETYDTVLRTGEPIRFERGLVTHGRVLELYAFRVEDETHRRVAVIFKDITERKQAEEEREHLLMSEQASRAEAETANRMKDNFLATVSHELRTPLNAIFGWIQLMGSRTLDEATFARAVETIARNARSQAKIIDDLMDISRIITGKLKLDVQPVELVPVIEAAIDAVRLAADAKSIRLKATLDPEAGPVVGDPNRLQQVIWNLLFNAIKFTPRQGSIEVGLKRAESRVIITVGDTGQGISEELLPYVFDRFRQADSTSARRHGGLGLGLSIVRQLVDMHGGNVHAASPGEGQGTTFTVALPLMAAHIETGDLYRRHPAEFSEVPLGSAPALDGIRVLVVDDEADAREIFRLMLEQCGAEVRTSATARVALEAIEEWRPDVLVSDIGMAGEDGYHLMKEVRALESERGGQIPAVALTGYASVEDQKKALAAGFQMHMPKPVALVELAAGVAVLAGRTGKVATKP